MNIDTFITTAKWFLIILCILSFVITIFRAYNWSKINPSYLYRVGVLVNAIGKLPWLFSNLLHILPL